MRGFLNSSGVLIFAMALVLAMFSFVLVGNDLHAASETGLIVEMARWAGDADDYVCMKTLAGTGNVLSTDAKLNFVSHSAGKAEVNYYTNDYLSIEVEYLNNNPPHLKINSVYDAGGGSWYVDWDSCDADQAFLSHNVSWSGNEEPTSLNPFPLAGYTGSGAVTVKAIDSKGLIASDTKSP